MKIIKNILILLFLILTGCGQQLVEFPVPKAGMGGLGGSGGYGGSDIPDASTPDSYIDKEAPIVITTVPKNEKTDVKLDSTITITFSENMDPASVNSNSVLLKQGDANIEGIITVDKEVAIFTPSNHLLPSTTYVGVVTIEVKDTNGNNMVEEYSWTFVTKEDIIIPTIIATTPLDGATNVPINTKITATFSTGMDENTVIDPETFVVTDPSLLPIQGVVTYDAGSKKVTFVTSEPLLYNTTYIATVSTLAATSTGVSLQNPYVWNFTTLITPDLISPQITVTNPVDLATDVQAGAEISATFNEDMLVETLNTNSFVVMDGLAKIEGSISYNELTKTVTFTPSNPLEGGKTYTAIISTEAIDLSGNPLEPGLVPNPWSFSTSEPIIPFISIDLGSASTYAIASTAGVTNTITAPITHINGDVILDPNQTCNAVATDNAGGFGLCNGMPPTLNGVVVTSTYPDTTTAIAVKADLNAAFLSITPPAGPPAVGSLGGGTPIPAPTTLGNVTGTPLVLGDNWFTPGVYTSITSILITGDITLDGGGDPNATFIFQSASSLTTADGAPTPGTHTRIILINGAKASNVWWQVGSSATIGLYTEFVGNVLAAFDITMNTGATSCGRLMSGAWVGGSGALVCDSNVVSVPGNGCAQ